MTPSAAPAVIKALVEQATAALPDVNVFDGQGTTTQFVDYLKIGVDDPDDRSGRRTPTAESEQNWVNQQSRWENGDVTCVANSSNGEADVEAARTAVYAIAEAVGDLCRKPNDQSLGVPELLWANPFTRTSLSQTQDNRGANARLIFTISFKARL